MPALPGPLEDASILSAHLWRKLEGAVHLQVFLAIGLSLLCFCLLLGCAICWHQRKKHRLDGRKARALGRVLADPRPGFPSQVTAVAIQQRGMEIEGDVPDAQAATGADPTGPPGHVGPHKGALQGRASLPSQPLSQKLSLPVQPLLGWQRRRTIAGTSGFAEEGSCLCSPTPGTGIPRSYTDPRGLSSPVAKPRPHLCFTVFYAQPTATLAVTVVGVSHLPKGLRAGRDSYVKVYLLPKFGEPQRTTLHRKSLNPEFQEQFHFSRCSPEELPGLTLRFTVHAKEFHSLKHSFLGEVIFPCAEVAWSRGVSSAYARELSATKTKLKKCFSAQDVESAVRLSQPWSMGQLFLLLQYQALANRIKVLVRKADNLGRLSRIPGTPDHYVMIHLYHDGKVIDTKETKPMPGYSPVWNTPFLLSVPAGGDIQKQPLSLEFTVMQARFTRTCAVGRVLIGPDAPAMGQVHWREMCSRGNVESARWHSIQAGGVPPCP
ncbi:synaptotagmin-11-like [Elgaria multicarinata webbii]|uniref:synaptotagmin-11-like n=1 Tax=Elgaria multicarinata webbii TaxID=159646 RepID=UPI002FCD58B3